MVAIKRLNSADANFKAALDELLAFEGAQDDRIDADGRQYPRRRKPRGDAAVIEYTNRFDRLGQVDGELELPRSELEAALNSLPADRRAALEAAAAACALPRAAAMQGWQYRSRRHLARPEDHPLDRVGLYVPGGKAAYPSSVLMNAIPARSPVSAN